MKKNTIITIVIIVAVITGGMLVFLNNKNSNNNKSTNVPAQKTTDTNQPTTTKVGAISIENFSFSPGTVIIKQGETVTWTNKDSTTHTVKSDSFNSQDIAQGETYQFTFKEKGSFNYSCGIHPSMTGKIVVE